ncbi:OsmC family protein [candidate division KSB1 bacterium]|nr:OsmC family protein [candidate division KSB1 bacterium]
MDLRIYFPGDKQVFADYRGFTIKTDQPLQGGGNNSAPAPFDLFLASIGTCAGIYILSFCQERRIPTTGIELIQSMERDPMTHRIRRIKLQIQVPPDFPEKYLSALIRAADLCAVKRYLQDPPEFEIATEIVTP